MKSNNYDNIDTVPLSDFADAISLEITKMSEEFNRRINSSQMSVTEKSVLDTSQKLFEGFENAQNLQQLQGALVRHRDILYSDKGLCVIAEKRGKDLVHKWQQREILVSSIVAYYYLRLVELKVREAVPHYQHVIPLKYQKAIFPNGKIKDVLLEVKHVDQNQDQNQNQNQNQGQEKDKKGTLQASLTAFTNESIEISKNETSFFKRHKYAMLGVGIIAAIFCAAAAILLAIFFPMGAQSLGSYLVEKGISLYTLAGSAAAVGGVVGASAAARACAVKDSTKIKAAIKNPPARQSGRDENFNAQDNANDGDSLTRANSNVSTGFDNSSSDLSQYMSTARIAISQGRNTQTTRRASMSNNAAQSVSDTKSDQVERQENSNVLDRSNSDLGLQFDLGYDVGAETNIANTKRSPSDSKTTNAVVGSNENTDSKPSPQRVVSNSNSANSQSNVPTPPKNNLVRIKDSAKKGRVPFMMFESANSSSEKPASPANAASPSTSPTTSPK